MTAGQHALLPTYREGTGQDIHSLLLLGLDQVPNPSLLLLGFP